MPENMRSSSIRFRVIADEMLAFGEKHHRDKRNGISRVNRITEDFGDRAADQIKPAHIDQSIADHAKTAATANRYRALF